MDEGDVQVTQANQTERPVETEIVCESREAALSEAQRRQATELAGVGAEWIYLRNNEGQWVARRVLPEPDPGVDAASGRSVFDSLVDFVVDLLS